MSQNKAIKSQVVVELEEFVKITDFAHNFLQLDLFHGSQEVKARKARTILIFLLNLAALSSYAFGNITNIYPQPFDMDKFSFVFSYLTTVLFGIIKYNCIFWRQRRLGDILLSLKRTYTKFESEKYQVATRLRKFKIFIRCYIVYMIPPMIFIFQMPLMEYSKSGEKILPFFIEYPFDTRHNVGLFMLALLIILYGDIVHITVMITSDHLIYGTVNALTLEFKVLKTKFRELKFKSDSDVKTDLRALIARHNALIDNAKEFQSIFAPMLFFNFALGSLFFCFTAFQCSSVDSISDAMMSFGFCFYSLFQIFMQCFFGQMLSDASKELIDEIYSCGWESVRDLKLRRDLLFIIMRSGETVVLRVLNIWPIKIEQFFTIVKSGYSYFTLCRHLFSKNI